MLSNELIVNVATFMQSVGSAYSKQLQILFAPEAIPVRLKHVLDKLEIYRYISYDAEKDLYTFMGCGEDNAMLAKDKLLALWPIVSMESMMTNTMMNTKMMTANSDNCSSPRHRELASVSKPPSPSPRIADSVTMGANASIGSAQPPQMRENAS